MQIAYWVLAPLLALLYLYAGAKKVAQSQEQLAPMMAWAGTTIAMPGVRVIGTLEVLGGIGLIVPPALGVATFLALLASIGLTVLQVLATAFHLSRGEAKDIWLNVALMLLGAVTIWLSTSV